LIVDDTASGLMNGKEKQEEKLHIREIEKWATDALMI